MRTVNQIVMRGDMPYRKLGKTRLWVCRTLACALHGADDLLEHCSKRLGVPVGGTTNDGKITLEFAECIGACEGAPAVLVNDEARMNVTPERVDGLIRDLTTDYTDNTDNK